VTTPLTTVILGIEGPVLTATAFFCVDVVVEETFGLEPNLRSRVDDSPDEYRVVRRGGIVEDVFKFGPAKGRYWLRKGKFGIGCLVLQLSSSFIISTPISPKSSINVVKGS
jgi:hypothetical protein